MTDGARNANHDGAIRTRVLTIPGLGSSGPAHWQTLWEQGDPSTFVRVEQRDWDSPDRNAWLETLDAAVSAAGPDIVLVGHSLGALLIAVWGARCQRPVLGALIVAPADAEAPNAIPEVAAWAPMPTARLPFRSIVAASANDPHITLTKARVYATAWGAELVELGAVGHVDSASGVGAWPKGRALLERLHGA